MSPRSAEQYEALRSEALAKISAAALAVFAEYGYHGATMRQIAKASGLSYGLVYHYYPSKADIFRQLVDFALEASLSAMRMVFAGPGSAWQKLEAYAGVFVQTAFRGDSARYFFIMLQAMSIGDAVPGLAEQVGARTQAYFEVLAPVIAQAQAEGQAAAGDPLVRATAFFAYLQGLSLFVFHRKGLEQQVSPDMLLDVLRNHQTCSC